MKVGVTFGSYKGYLSFARYVSSTPGLPWLVELYVCAAIRRYPCYFRFIKTIYIYIWFVKTFIDEPWTEQVSASNMVLVDKSFVLPDFFELEADLIYRTKIGDQDVYFYILLEMQSSVDFSMPIRLFYYMGEIWRDVLKNLGKNEIKRKEFQLPMIVPIVLYNGATIWNVPTQFKHKVKDFELFGEHVMNFEYTLVDVNRYSEQTLVARGNLPAALVFLDQIVDKQEFVERLKKVALSFKQLNIGDKQQLKNWLERILDEEFNESIKDMMTNLILSDNEFEVENMTANIVKTWIAEKEEAKNLKSVEIAKNFLLLGASIEMVAEGTNLTINEVEKLKEELGL